MIEQEKSETTMTNQLKLKKPLIQIRFNIIHEAHRIEVLFYHDHVEFRRLNKGRNEGHCPYHYETPEKGEKFIFEMYRQLVMENNDHFLIPNHSPFTFSISKDCIDTFDVSSLQYHPIPVKEFFRQLRERLKEIVEEVDTMAELQKQAQELDMGYAQYPIVHHLHGYKITIERG